MRRDHAPIVAVALRCTADFRSRETAKAYENIERRVAEARAWLAAKTPKNVIGFGDAKSSRAC